jgi:hypothetical protein
VLTFAVSLRQSWNVTTDTQTLASCLARYARRLHAAIGPQHHVASPLGAWLLLALAGPAASGTDRETLTDVLGCDVDTAARLAAGLLEHPHPLVASAAAAWTRPGAPLGPGFHDWRAALPAVVATGDLPDQAELDAWASEHTFGLIDRFPVEITPDVYLVLATALATRVSWQTPFDLAPASELGVGSPWAGELSQVLRTPHRGQGHAQFIASTSDAGDAVVHLALARDGLLVASVAADDGVAYGDVLAAAQRIACACAVSDPGLSGRGEVAAEVPRRRLADLPLGEAPLWQISEDRWASSSQDLCTAVLPAWSAESTHALDAPELGFGTAARALAGPDPWQAAQSALARYSRTGFEAAAVTALAVAAMAMPRHQTRRVAELRFAHPYAVVAVAIDPALSERDHGPERKQQPASPWHGVPVFSAWVARPENATGDEADAAR